MEKHIQATNFKIIVQQIYQYLLKTYLVISSWSCAGSGG